MQKFRFWLSGLIFEKLLKRPPAQTVGEKITKEIDKWNEERGVGKCQVCKSKSLVNDYNGSEGLFSSPHHFYRCTKCGNAQENYSLYSYKYLSDELGRKRIKEVSDGKFYYCLLSGCEACFISLFLVCVSFLIILWKI